ncbi:MAG: glycerol-3-phosphate 1-O-acyltransferase PlsY [Panacagrimonas sp.]
MGELIIKAALAYLLGNIMGGYLVGRLRGGVDLRAVGSGNVGATNALRTQGTSFALMVLAIDVGKGVVGALLVPMLPLGLDTPSPFSMQQLGYVCGAAVTLGHCYPALWGFSGGKGVATLAGVFGALLPWGLPWILLGFVGVVLVTGYVSLGTLTAAAVAVLYVAAFDARGAASDVGAFTAFMAALVVLKHRDNILRLLRGSESRFDKLRVIGKWLER